ncbi:F-box protein SKIP22-like [Punica granatum]|uniref:F-box protein SKIP22-like n=1 Tax=Punica granatum TaxID=22663 RepID=A0A6P8CTA0_PUNGR|nr:F-box protein SKIP22-like [Punica granatum]
MDLELEDVGGLAEEKEQPQSSGERNKHSVPHFLRRVLREELGKDDHDEVQRHRLLVFAIHAVMLESGFLEVTRTSGTDAYTFSLSYTLPELIADKLNEVESVVLNLEFPSMGRHWVNGGLQSNSIWPVVRKFAPAMIDLMLGNSSSSLYPKSEVFEFWNVVKDRLALPLLIDLCEMADLPLPSCLMSLPMELKLQILGLLDVQDLLRMARGSKEFQYLSTHNDLWKQKFLSEFGDVKEMQGALNIDWKASYMIKWKSERDRISSSGTGLQAERPVTRRQLDQLPPWV